MGGYDTRPERIPTEPKPSFIQVLIVSNVHKSSYRIFKELFNKEGFGID